MFLRNKEEVTLPSDMFSMVGVSQQRHLTYLVLNC